MPEPGEPFEEMPVEPYDRNEDEITPEPSGDPGLTPAPETRDSVEIRNYSCAFSRTGT